MKKETLKLVLKIMNERGEETTNHLIQAAENAELIAATRMGTSGNPDWLAPYSVNKREILQAEKAIISTPKKSWRSQGPVAGAFPR